jgi:hypothetical protein
MLAEKLQPPQKVKLCLLDFRYVGVLKQLFEDEKARALIGDEDVRNDIAMFVNFFEEGDCEVNAKSEEDWNKVRGEWVVEVRPELINSIKEIMIKNKQVDPLVADDILKFFVQSASSLPVS